MPESPDATPPTLPLAARLAIDDVCDAFEADLRAGRVPRVEDFLGNRPEPERAHLFAELVKLEREYRASAELKTTAPHQSQAGTGTSAFHRSPATRFSPCWAKAGWGWCTRPGTAWAGLSR